MHPSIAAWSGNTDLVPLLVFLSHFLSPCSCLSSSAHSPHASLFLSLSAQSQMMGRGFYSPLHSMWGSAFGTSKPAYSTGSSFYSTSSSSPTHGGQPRDTQLDHNVAAASANTDDYGLATASADTSAGMNDFNKQTSEHLIGLTSGYGMHGSSRKMPEGSSAANSGTAYPYYSTELAMYGSSFAAAASGRNSLQSSRPKPKSKSNAGKQRVDQSITTIGCGC